ncbi:glyoxalase/bleomycin resistance/dioxygenase family protein [Hahella aquimaris]|uniref:VOC family protein n=1 Tax=Hahella sp. HNIBRBA332 TaxID=3015983 RepID=UPI00273C7F7F|nr:VOC family protein [Hahella sp. HNIBRBA332]WLQ15437.1 glyoxalase/bleomycin resistance/dioxygenase family protein [Hahella sp. HNIBRBA332]
MAPNNERPSVSVGHVTMETNQMEASAQFMLAIGMRPIFRGADVSVFELRGGTHLILMNKATITPGDASFDLMVDDLLATHEYFTSLGFAPSPIEDRPNIDHQFFQVKEPAGHSITFYSSHASKQPV